MREQVARISASPAFRNSKRCTDFLRYTVEHTINGDTENIKERILGVEVFGRALDYDTSSDPVVRTSAVEVRKRLRHYYRLHNQSGEIQIDFPRGTYVPEFVWPQAQIGLRPADEREETDPEAKDVEQQSGPAKRGVGKWLISALATAVLVVFVLLGWTGAATSKSPTDRFWAPVMNSNHTVLLCIPDKVSSLLLDPNTVPAAGRSGSSSLTAPPPSRDHLFFMRNHVFFVDMFVVAQIAGGLGKQGRAFRLVHTEDATLDDLQQGPAVLIGGTNNPWIVQISSSLRFGLATDGSVDYVSDRQNPFSRQWALPVLRPTNIDENPDVDYAVISRITRNITGQPIVIVAGLHQMGTEAAGKCFSDPDCFAQAEQLAPGDWQRENLQFVVETKILNHMAGQPKVIAASLSPSTTW